jgi:exodeoxyribonuclease VII small subunit
MAKQKNVEDLTYEEAFGELEALVAALEGDSRPLDESMQMYERGQALAKRCAQLLESAELRVKQLVGETEVDFEGDE